jgi:hypothetical protein
MRAPLLCKHCDNELETDVYSLYLWDSQLGQLLDVTTKNRNSVSPTLNESDIGF